MAPPWRRPKNAVKSVSLGGEVVPYTGQYTPQIGAWIRDQLAVGRSLLSICEESGIPYKTAHDWERDNPQHAADSARARSLGCHYMAEEAKRIADEPMTGITTETTTDDKGITTRVREGDMIEHRRLMIDTRMRLIGKWLPKVYGDRQQVELQGELTISDRLARAQAKLERKEPGEP